VNFRDSLLTGTGTGTDVQTGTVSAKPGRIVGLPNAKMWNVDSSRKTDAS